MLKEVKLPGGCYLSERKPEIRKINLRELDIIPFPRYRFQAEEDSEDELEYESTWFDAFLPVVCGIAIVLIGLFL